MTAQGDGEGFEFELEPIESSERRGYRGDVGPFGGVEAFVERTQGRRPPTRQAHLEGEQFPETLFSGGAHTQPSLDGGWLKVDGTMADLELIVKGIRRGARWLEIGHRDRSYTYRSGGYGTDARLTREGAIVSFTKGRLAGRVGRTRIGQAEGEVDAVDLAIATVLEVVDTEAMSTTGALLALPFNFLFGRTRDEGSIE